MKNMRLLKSVVIMAGFCLTAPLISRAQTFTTLLSFQKTDYLPGDLVQGRNGSLYSISGFGGTNAEGSVIEITDQNVSTVYNFCSLTNCADGAYPQVGVLLGTDGNFYGTTFDGGNSTCKGCGSGTVFKVTPSGKLTTLYDFCSLAKCADGYDPEAKLTQASNGTFFGTTFYGGTNPGPYNVGYGTLFEITSSGKFTSLYSFCSQTNCTDGSHPHWAPIQATNGNIYGTTYWGGANNSGTIFSLSNTGQLATMYSFTQPKGSTFTSGPLILMQASDGNLYGTTNYGGTNAEGTIFKVTTSGTFTNLYTFCSLSNCTDGTGPTSLIEGPDGNFYGTTFGGGTGLPVCGGLACGTIFKLTRSGILTTLYDFCRQTSSCPDGNGPLALLLATNGTLYGTTQGGGTSGDGTLFSLSMGFNPLVQPNPTAGKAGQSIGILGNDLTGTTSVAFNGTAATFTLVSSTFLRAAVPTGAKSGPIQVTTPSGTLTSIVHFQVK